MTNRYAICEALMILLLLAVLICAVLLSINVIRSFAPVFLFIALALGVGFAWGWLESREKEE